MAPKGQLKRWRFAEEDEFPGMMALMNIGISTVQTVMVDEDDDLCVAHEKLLIRGVVPVDFSIVVIPGMCGHATCGEAVRFCAN